MPEKEPRDRGVRLRDLDKERRYVIGYSGRRWEVVGQVPRPGSAEPQRRAQPAPAGEHRGRHAAP